MNQHLFEISFFYSCPIASRPYDFYAILTVSSYGYITSSSSYLIFFFLWFLNVKLIGGSQLEKFFCRIIVNFGLLVATDASD